METILDLVDDLYNISWDYQLFCFYSNGSMLELYPTTTTQLSTYSILTTTTSSVNDQTVTELIELPSTEEQTHGSVGPVPLDQVVAKGKGQKQRRFDDPYSSVITFSSDCTLIFAYLLLL